METEFKVQLFLWLMFDKAVCYFQYSMEHLIQLGRQHLRWTLLLPFWSTIGLVNIHISQFISLLYIKMMYVMEL